MGLAKASGRTMGIEAMVNLVESLALVVPKQEGEAVRRTLIEMGALRRDLRIEASGGHILFPVTERVPLAYSHRRHEFAEADLQPRSYRELIRIPEALHPFLPTSYDIVGDILILKLPQELKGYEESLGSALLRAHRGVATVALDEGVEGTCRVRSLSVIAGRKSTRTVHREFGLEIAVDPARVYFSPRLAGERRRVALQVRKGEVVVDAFCGAGPFTLHVARAGAQIVYSIDANPRAVEFLRENLRRNRLENVVPIEGRVEEAVPRLGPADRVILDFPTDPFHHFKTMMEVLRPGGVLHYYEILERALLQERIDLLRGSLPRGMAVEVLGVREVRGYSPSRAHYAIDLRVSRG